MTQPARRNNITVQIASQQKTVSVDRRLLRRAVTMVLRDARISKALVSVAVVDDETIARLNWEFLRHRGPADVLSFLLDDSDGLEGEVIVGAEVALRTAAEYGWTPHEELLLYAVHGTLHLVGHDDRTPRQRAAMQRRENDVLEAIGIKRQ